MAAKLAPLHDRVLVKRLDPAERTPGGLIIPDVAREKSQQGEVMAVGPGRIEKGERIPLDVKVGDIVLLSKYAGIDFDSRSTATPIKIGDEDYLVIKEDEILGIISGASKAAKGK